MKHTSLLLTPAEKGLILDALSALIQNGAIAGLLGGPDHTDRTDRTADVLAFLDAHPLLCPETEQVRA